LPPPSDSSAGLIGWLDVSAGEADVQGAKAQVRDSGDGFSVLVVEGVSDGQWRLPDWLTVSTHGELLPTNEAPRAVAREALAGTSVSLPDWVCSGRAGERVITALEALMPPAWQKTPDLCGELIMPLDANCQWRMEGLIVSYDKSLGLQARRSNER